MFHIVKEGAAVATGLNFYPLSDPNSFGFRLKAFNTLYICRFSKSNKKFHFQKIVYDPNANKQFEDFFEDCE